MANNIQALDDAICTRAIHEECAPDRLVLKCAVFVFDALKYKFHLNNLKPKRGLKGFNTTECARERTVKMIATNMKASLSQLYNSIGTSFLKYFWAGNWYIKLLNLLKTKSIWTYPMKHFIFYYLRALEGGIIQSKLPSGVVLQPSDCLMENYLIYRSEVFDRFHDIQNDDVVIDIGAHVGLFTLKAARKAENGVVVAIEPHPANYRLLLYNLKCNKIKNAIPMNCALSDCSGVTSLYVGVDSISHSTSQRRRNVSSKIKESSIRVKTETLDKLIQKLGLEKVDFVKINTEGSELNILQGAERILQTRLSVVIATNHYPNETHHVSKYLQTRNYKTISDKSRSYVYATNMVKP